MNQVPRCGTRQTHFVSSDFVSIDQFQSKKSFNPSGIVQYCGSAHHVACCNICCSDQCGLNRIAAHDNQVLPSSYGLILSECGGNHICHD